MQLKYLLLTSIVSSVFLLGVITEADYNAPLYVTRFTNISYVSNTTEDIRSAVNETAATTVFLNCSSIFGADTDFCVDADSGGAGADTNASTACSANELLDGDNNCIFLGNFTNTTAEMFLVLDNGTFVRINGSTMSGNLIIDANLTVDTTLFFVDSATNRVGIGQTTGFDPRVGLSVTGDIDLNHTATENDDHAMEINLDAAGFGDVKAIDIIYKTGAISAGEEEEAILIIIDESAATGGDVIGVEILATEGDATIYGLEAGVLVNPVVQLSGTFEDMDSANNSGENALFNFTNTTEDVTIFASDDDYVIIGNADKFEEIEFLLNTTASNPGIKPIFSYSTGVGTWSTFSPTDGTNGLRNTGVISWFDEDIPSWDVGEGNEYLINITRTQNILQTVPIEDKVQISSAIKYLWSRFGDLEVRNINATIINATDWSNVTITEAQISDLAHTTDTNASTTCSAYEFLDGDNNCVLISNFTNTSAEVFSTVDNSTFTRFSDTITWGNLSTWSLDNVWAGLLHWGNLTAYNLNTAWQGALHWGNLTAYNLNVAWLGELWYGNITGLPVYRNDTDTNASTACSANEVLDGDNKCILLANFTNTTTDIFTAVDNDTFLRDVGLLNFTNVNDLRAGNITDLPEYSNQTFNTTYDNYVNLNMSNLTLFINCTGIFGADADFCVDDTSSTTDTNASTACGTDEFLDGDDDCVLIYNLTNTTTDVFSAVDNNTFYRIGDFFNFTNVDGLLAGNITDLPVYQNNTDTNASTACSAYEFLDGDNNCVLIANFTNTTSEIFDAVDNDTFLRDVGLLNFTNIDNLRADNITDLPEYSNRTFNSTYDDYVNLNMSNLTLFINCTGIFGADADFCVDDTAASTDTNASTACGTDEFLDGDDDCVLIYNLTNTTSNVFAACDNSTWYRIGHLLNYTNVGSLRAGNITDLPVYRNDTDTNASTACSTGEFLDGDNNCVLISNFTNTTTGFFSAIDNDTFVRRNGSTIFGQTTFDDGSGDSPVLSFYDAQDEYASLFKDDDAGFYTRLYGDNGNPFAFELYDADAAGSSDDYSFLRFGLENDGNSIYHGASIRWTIREATDGKAGMEMSFWTSTNNTPMRRITINTTGQVGINTETPTHNLSVLGAIDASQFMCAGSDACIASGNISDIPFNTTNQMFASADNGTFVEKAGDSMTGNLSFGTTTGISYNGNWTYNNGTCVIIMGRTSQLEVC